MNNLLDTKLLKDCNISELISYNKYNQNKEIMLDRNGNFLEKYQGVDVPDPNSSDIHNHAFMGTIIDILESRGTAIIEDQCGDVFEIETERLVIND